jgi:hypothetical protein
MFFTRSSIKNTFAIFALLMVPPAFGSAPETQISSHFTSDFDLENITDGFIHGRYRVTTDIEYLTPTGILPTEIEVGDDENGTAGTAPALYVEGAPLITQRSVFTEIDSNGNVVGHSLESNRNVNGQLLLSGINGGISEEVIPLQDRVNGKRFTLTLRSNQFVNLNLKKIDDTHSSFESYIRDASSSSLVFTMDIVMDPQGLDRAHLIERYITTLPDGEKDPNPTECSRAGASRPLHDEILGSGTRIHRLELCYPAFWSDTGYRRIVLPVAKPQTNPKLADLVADFLHGPYSKDIEISPGITEVENTDAYQGMIASRPLLPIASDLLPETNCHGYAVRATSKKVASLLPEHATWVDGLSSLSDEGTQPFQTILHENYTLIKKFQSEDGAGIGSDPSLRAGDLLTYVMGVDYVHSGVLIKNPHGNGLWLESKAEEGPIVDTPVENASETYSFNAIQVYRANDAYGRPQQ